MDETLKKMLKNGLGSVVRAALIFVGAWLVRKGYVTSEDADGLTIFAPEIAGGLLTLGGVGWGIYQKIHANKKVDAALAAPAKLSRAEFEERFKDGDLPEPVK